MTRSNAVLAVVLLALGGCKKDEGPSATPPKAPAPTPAAAPAGPSADAPEYAVTLSAPALKAGAEAQATFAIAAKGSFHVNPDYPMAFTPDGAQNVKFAAEKVKLAFGEKTPCAAKAEDACAVTVPLAVTAEQAGPGKVAGTLAFSVCDPERCLIQKVPLALAVTAQ